MMVGNTPRGYGGCCGTYRITPVVQSAVQSTEDSKIIKPSVLGTYGMIETKYRWIRRPQPFSVTKPDTNQNFNDQGTYIFILQQNTLNCNAEIDASTNLLDIGTPTNVGCLKSTDDQVPVVCNNITKSNTYTGAIDQGMYIQQVDSACTKNIMFPMNRQNVPFGCNINSAVSPSIVSNNVPYSNRAMNYSKHYSVNLG